MPEGDTILRAARSLSRVLAGRTVVAFASTSRALAKASLVGRSVTAVESHGKNLIFRFDDGHVLHSHMGMTGSWHIYRPGERWRKSPRLAHVVIEVEGFVVICFSPRTLQFLTPSEEERVIGGLGPDILAVGFDHAEARRGLELQGPRPIGDALLMQGVIAGIGNVYKSETLFLTRIDPRAPVAFLAGDKLDTIVREAEKLMRANVQPASRMRVTRGSGSPGRYWVYARAGAPCFVCGSTIVRIYQGGKDTLRRSTYFCPRCQTLPPVA